VEREPYYDSEGVFHDPCLWCGVERCQINHPVWLDLYYRELARFKLMRDGYITATEQFKSKFTWWLKRNGKHIHSSGSWHFDQSRDCWCIIDHSDAEWQESPNIEVMTIVKEEQGQITVERLMKLTPEQMGWYEHVLKGWFLKNRKELGDEEAFRVGLKEAEKAEAKAKRVLKYSSLKSGNLLS